MLNRKRKRGLDDGATAARNLEIMSDNKPGKKHRESAVSPLQLVKIVGSDDENDFVKLPPPPPHSDRQRRVHASLKKGAAKLCKLLKLSDDVVHLVHRLLKYLVVKRIDDVSKGDKDHLQAIQMSLCWIATDILGQKIDREALLEASKILKFKCHENLANSVFENLIPLKEKFQQLHGKTSDSLRNVASPLADTAVHSTNLEEPCVEAEVIELSDHEENVQKSCEKSKMQLRKKHMAKFQEFDELWKKKREKLMEEHEAEFARSLEENYKICLALQGLEWSKELERRALEKKCADEMEEENRKCEARLAEAEAKYGRGGSTTIDDANPRELESSNDDQLSKNSGSAMSAPPIIIVADALVLNVSGDGEIEVVDNEPVHMQVAIPLSDEPVTTNVSLQNPNDLAASKVDYSVPIVTEIPSTNKDTETDSVIIGSHVDPLPENEPSTVGKDLADCLKPVDLQTVIATDNGNTMVSPHEHGDSAGFHKQPVVLNEGHTMLHDSDDSSIQPSSVGKVMAEDYLKPVDQQTASTTDNGTSEEQSIVPCSDVVSSHERSESRVNIVNSADYSSHLDSQTAEEPDKTCDGEQSAGGQVDTELSDTHVNIADSADCDGRPDLQTAEEEPVEICVGEQSAGFRVDRELSDTHVNIADSADCDSRPDLQTGEEEPVEIGVGEQSAGAQAQNLLSQTQVVENAGELKKQPALENAEDIMILSPNNTSDTVESDHPNLPTVCGTGVEDNEPQHSSQNHTLSDVAENTAELQTAAVLPNSSNTVSIDLPPVSAIYPEPISEAGANAVLPWTAHFASLTNQWLLADPLEREFIRRRNEKEQFDKLHKDNISLLNAACDKEIEETCVNLRSKYAKKLEDAEASFTEKMTETEANRNKLIMNRLLAEAFRYKCRYVIPLGSNDMVQPG